MAATPARQLRYFASLTAIFGALHGCAACEDPGVSPLYPALEVTPAVLDFGEVPIGVRVQGAVTLLSTGEVRVTIDKVEMGESLFRRINEPRLTLEPSQSDVVQIEARPTALGLFETTITIRSDDRERRVAAVPVRLLAIPTPPCDDGNACTEDWFDEDIGDCGHRFTDGVACQPADRCVIDAVCSLGVCLGKTKVCDDESPCTNDFCRQTDGMCVFLDAPDACDDTNPCTADSCDPNGGGCAYEMIPSGSPCDDGDLCTSDDACFAGACVGDGVGDGAACDDRDSCTHGDTCLSGVCTGVSLIEPAAEGEVVFEYALTEWDSAFLHRREVSLSSQSGVFYGLDHLRLTDPQSDGGLTHVVFGMEQCGTTKYQFSYRPPDSHVLVSYVRREMQVSRGDNIRMVVGVRQRPQDGFMPQTTTYLLDAGGNVLLSGIQTVGGETGRSLLPDGSHIYGVISPLNNGPFDEENVPQQNLVVVREDVNGNVLWRHERSSELWSEFLGVAGPRVLFWASQRFGALDFNTGAIVWSQPTSFITKEMALSTQLNLGIARVATSSGLKLLAVEILSGNQVFTFPPTDRLEYQARTDPVIAPDGRILVLMEVRDLTTFMPVGLDWVELDQTGAAISTTRLPYAFPIDWGLTRHEDDDDPYPTVADDGVAYVGYGDSFYAIDPGGHIRWTHTSTVPNAFTGTVPVLRHDGVVLINERSRKIIGIRTNGGQMVDAGWSSFRHDGERTNFTP